MSSVRRILFFLAVATLAVAGALLVTALSLALFEIVVTTDLAVMQAWLDAHGAWLTALRMIIYTAIWWILPVWLQAPRKTRLNMRIQLAVSFVFLDALVIHQFWRAF